MDFQTICRICTSEKAEMISIFESYKFSLSSSEIFKVIIDCAAVQIRKCDGFSERICHKCLEDLTQAYNFKKLCEESDYKFRNGLIASNAIYIKSEDAISTHHGVNHYINENMDESSQITDYGLTEVKQEQCDDEIKPDVNEIEQELDFSSVVCQSMECEEPSTSHKSEENAENGTFDSSYTCELCSESFSIKQHLTLHMKNHAEQSPNIQGNTSTLDRKRFKCDICEKEFTQRSSLSRHIKLHNGEYQYECKLCDKKFSQSGNYNVHVRSHMGKKPYECNICEKTFTTNGSLTAHFRIHTGEKPYTCSFCGKGFVTSSALTSHSISHSGEKHYQCEFCDKKFAKTTNLNRHIRMHTGEKRYKCEFCQKRFTHSSNLKRHVRKHTGETPYQCDFCERRFSQSNSLARHIGRLHSR